MKILLIRSGEEPVLSEIEGTLVSMQKVVGGPIELIYPFDDPVTLVCHEEGKLLGLPLNRIFRDQAGRIYDAIAGPFFLCGAPSDSDRLDSIPQKLVEKYRQRFASPEVFIKVNGVLHCIPVKHESVMSQAVCDMA